MFSNIQRDGLLLKIVVTIIFITLITGLIFFSYNSKDEITQINEIVYKNNNYGFSFSLPESWKGYSINADKWIGNKTDNQVGDVAFNDGPIIYIHNPKWNGTNTYQDIPIMIFTIAQWNDLNLDKFHIGAAPINPSELARNSKYIFALPARYNYAFPPGYEEVEEILKSNPIKTFSPEP